MQANDGYNSLHGGGFLGGLNVKEFAMEPFTDHHGEGVRLAFTSPDGDQVGGTSRLLSKLVTLRMPSRTTMMALHGDFER